MNVGLHPRNSARLNTISVCTGGGGLDLGLELAVPGYRPVAYVEREAFACAHLVAAMEQGLMGKAPLWSDARTFPGRQFRGRVDCVVGGIPCQPHSGAGRRLGRADERDLWSVFRRIVVQTGAWCCLIENTRGMVTSGGFERLWRDLRRLGFEVEPGLFSAAEVGARHERARLFVLAVKRDALADINHARLQGFGADADAQGWQDARRQAGLCGVTGMAHSGCGDSEQRYRADEIRQWPSDPEQARLGGGELDHADEPELQRGRRAGDVSSTELADNPGCRGRAIPVQPRRQEQAREDIDRGGAGHWPFFAPGPADELWSAVATVDIFRLPALSRYDVFIDACRNEGVDPHGHPGGAGRAAARLHAAKLQEIAQRTLRRMADGVAGPLDKDRIDALRMLGNGVVPLQAAYAIRSLVHALAARTGADPSRFVC